VFYGTDRFATGSKTPDTAFGRERSRAQSLHLGVCKVSVPRSHQPGMIEEPALWLFRPDPSKHMVLLGRESLSSRSFFKRMQDTLGKSRRKELLVFVHGFNVSFKDAVLRTAQMATDLRIDGVPVVYSWPSEASLLQYMVDSNNAEWTIQHLEPFLWDLSRKSGASSIYLVAHSMGNRPLTRALERIALQLKAASPARPPFSQILLTAPDIDADVFADLAKNFYRAGDRVTLYASSRDVALNISNWVNKYPRAGDSGEGMPVAPNVDIIDVSSIDSSLRGFGHSYYGDNCTVLSDIYRLLREGKPPKLRGLDQIAGGAYWVIQAASACPP
jgi:esterase/lipase superfamily enzyme